MALIDGAGARVLLAAVAAIMERNSTDPHNPAANESVDNDDTVPPADDTDPSATNEDPSATDESGTTPNEEVTTPGARKSPRQRVSRKRSLRIPIRA